jgi:hypothetical protein
MQVQLPILDKNDQPIYKNITTINIIYIGCNKELYIFKKPFIEQDEWCTINLNNLGYVFAKSHICWRRFPPKRFHKKYAEWQPYILIMDSKAHDALMP